MDMLHMLRITGSKKPLDPLSTAFSKSKENTRELNVRRNNQKILQGERTPPILWHIYLYP
jgi:hypothetical protein